MEKETIKANGGAACTHDVADVLQCEICRARSWDRQKSQVKPEVGEFVDIPGCKTFGMVVGLENAWYGPDGAFRALVQEYPDQPAHKMRWYHLEPGQYTIEG
jgi:hypothetical protein